MRPHLAAVLLIVASCSDASIPTDDDTTSASSNDDSAEPTPPSPSDDDSAEPTPPGDDDDTTPDLSATYRSSLYPDSWTPAFTGPDGRFLHDFSYAGYHRGEMPLPDVAPGPQCDIVDQGADPTGQEDATAVIQGCVDSLTEGGVVFVPAGLYRVDGLVVIERDGVVLSGEGEGSRLWFTRTEGMSDTGHITARGSVQRGADLPLAEDGVARSHTVRIADASSLAVGAEVSLGWVITDDFVADHGMTGTWTQFNGQWRAFERRTVSSIDTTAMPHTVSLDIPLRSAALLRDGASLRVESGAIREVGVEHLAVATAGDWDTAWSLDRTHAIHFIGVRDAWVRDVHSFESPGDPAGAHLLSGGLKILDSTRVTVADSHFADAQNRGGGGNGYLFEVSRSTEVLTIGSTARAGRHNFIQNWDFGTSGCVWTAAESHDGRALFADWDPIGSLGYSEYHHSLARANLVEDSVVTDGWQGVHRGSDSSGAGHSATENVFWNLRGGGQLRSLQWGMGYVIAPNDMNVTTDPATGGWQSPGAGTAPEDWVEGLDESRPIEPQSLYADQLARRLAG